MTFLHLGILGSLGSASSSLHVELDASGRGRLSTFPKQFSTTFSVGTNYRKLNEIDADDLNVVVHYKTDGDIWFASFYNGLQKEWHTKEGNYKLAYKRTAQSPTKNAELFCEKIVDPDDMKTWNSLKVFPEDIDQYEYIGEATVRNVRTQKWKAPLVTPKMRKPRLKTSHMYFYVDLSTGAPIRWSISRSRNPIYDAHYDEWVIDYITFDTSVPTADQFQLDGLCLHNKWTPIHAASFQQNSGSTANHSRRYEHSPLLHKIWTRAKGLRRPQKVHQPSGVSATKTLELVDPPDIKLPETWDMEKLGFAGPVRDQGFCGSCWAFAMTQAVASSYQLKRFREGRAVSYPVLSTQQVLDCGWTENSQSCEGGFFDDTSLGQHDYSLVDDYGGYLSINGRCHDSKVAVRTTGWRGLKMTGLTYAERTEILKRGLVAQGLLAINLACPDELSNYTKGVLDVDSCDNVKDQDRDHAVVLAGFGTDLLPYLKMKNSWSSEWGEGGYARISERKDCGINLSGSFPIFDEDLPDSPESEKAREVYA